MNKDLKTFIFWILLDQDRFYAHDDGEKMFFIDMEREHEEPLCDHNRTIEDVYKYWLTNVKE
jgi:hypothetical protein